MPESNRQPGADEVRAQLERILGSDAFYRSQRMSRFLTFVAEKELMGTGNLSQLQIAAEVFDRKSGFNPSENPIVRVEAARLRRELAKYYGTAIDDPVRIELPKGSYRARFTRTGTASVSPTRRSPSLTVAVSGSIDAVQLTGLREALFRALGSYSHIELLDDSDGDAPTYSLQVTARKNLEEQISVDASLLANTSRQRLWSDQIVSYYPPEDPIDAENDLARVIAAQVASSYGEIMRHVWRQADSFERVLTSEFRARLTLLEYHLRPSNDTLATATEILEREFAQNPDLPEVCAAYAQTYIDRFVFLVDNKPEHIDVAERLVDRALSVDRRCQPAWLGKGQIALIRRDAALAIRHARRMLECNESEYYMQANAGMIIAMAGRYTEGTAIIDEALATSPFLPTWLLCAKVCLNISEGEYEEAARLAEDFALSEFVWGPLLRAAAYGLSGDVVRASASRERLLDMIPGFDSQARRMIEYWYVDPELVDRLVYGLRIAAGDNRNLG